MSRRHRLLCVLVGLVAAGQCTRLSAGALQNVFVSRTNGVAAIEIRFRCLHRFASQSPAGPATTFAISLIPGDQCASTDALTAGEGPTRPAGREMVALEDIEYVARDGGPATLQLVFNRPVQINVVQAGDLGALQIRLRAASGLAGDAGPPESAVTAPVPLARTPERLARADAVARERAARSDAPVAEPTGNYAINVATAGAEPVSADLAGLAAGGRRAYIVTSEYPGGTVYQLRLGFFATEAEAETALAALRTRYPRAWVVKVGAADHARAAAAASATTPAGTGAQPVGAAAATGRAAAASLSAGQLSELMAEARTAMLAGDFGRAAALYAQVVAEPPNEFSQESRELLGVARQRNGELPQAIAEYRRYMEEFPDGDGAARVSQRLAALTTARDAPKSSLRAASRPDAGAWETFGSFSQYYRRDSGDYGMAGMTTRSSMVMTDGAFDLRKRGENLDFATRARLGYDYDLLDEPASPGNRTRVYDLYADLYRRDWDLGVRVGRQTERSAGVLGRYDGAHLSYQARPDVKLNLMGGFPVYLSSDSVDTSRVFYALSVDLAQVLESVDTSFFVNTQTIDGTSDRQAAGAEVRYFDGTRSFAGVVDYDFELGTLNTLTAVGNWYFDSGMALSASADYRRTPFPLTEDALIGQTAGSIDELLQFFTEDEIRDLAVDRTGETLNYSLGVSRPFAERWQVNADVTFTQLSQGPGSGGVLALPDSDRGYYVYTSLVGSSLFTGGDVSILGINYFETWATRVATIYLDTRYPLTSSLRVNPRLALSRRDITADNSTETFVSPRLRLLYRLARRYELELEGGGDLGSRNGADNTDTTAYYIYMGYRVDF